MSLQQAFAPLLIWLILVMPISVKAEAPRHNPPPPTPVHISVQGRMGPRISDLNFPFPVAVAITTLLAAPPASYGVVAAASLLGAQVVQSSSYSIKGRLRLLINRRSSMYGRQADVLWAGFGPRSDDLDSASPEVLKLVDTVYELSSTVITSKYNALPRIMIRARGETEAFLKAFMEAVPDKTRRERILGQSLMGQLLQYQALIFQVFQVATSEDSEAINRVTSAVNDKQFYALLKQEAFRTKKNRASNEPAVASGN